MIRAALCAFFMAFALSRPFAQDGAAVRVRVAASVSVDGGADESWASSLEAALIRSPRVSAVRRVPAGIDPSDFAAAAGCDILLVVRAETVSGHSVVQLERRILKLRNYSILSADSGEFRIPSGFDLSQTFWLPSVAAVEAAADRLAESGQRPVSPIGAADRSSWSLESGLYMGQFPDLWFGRGFLVNRIFLKIGLYQFLTGVYFGEEHFGSVSYALVQPGVSFGAYLFRLGASVRPYLTSSVFSRFSGDGFAVDPIAPVGGTAMIGAEWRAGNRIGAFFEAGLAYYPFCDAYLLAVELGGDDGGYAFFYSSDRLVEFPQFRFGLRIYP